MKVELDISLAARRDGRLPKLPNSIQPATSANRLAGCAVYMLLLRIGYGLNAMLAEPWDSEWLGDETWGQPGLIRTAMIHSSES
jgi:hypothetical protein